MTQASGGPLAGIRVVEMVGLGPGPFCAMMLADMGAEVIRIDQPQPNALIHDADGARLDVVARGRRSITLDLKSEAGREAALTLIGRADALIEGYRPGVMERLGLSPEACLARQPRLVYGRMTGWGQTGPLAQAAGHDINYIALSGLLQAMGRADTAPPPPLNLVGDYGGGAMMLAFGIVCALLEAGRSGQGQVIDAAMTDGSALLGAIFYGLKAAGRWQPARGANLLDGGAHFYDCYRCADGRHIAVGAIEPKFHARLLELMGLDAASFSPQMEPSQWPARKAMLAQAFATRSRDEWCRLLEGSDACFAPVLDMDEAPAHPHHRARQSFIELDGVVQPAPAPRFSRTPGAVRHGPARPGEHTDAVLRDWGFDAAAIAALHAAGGCGPTQVTADGRGAGA